MTHLAKNKPSPAKGAFFQLVDKPWLGISFSDFQIHFYE